MSNVFSRACALFVVLGGLGIGACASPSGPRSPSDAERDTVDCGRWLWTDGHLPWSYGHDARE